MDAYAIRTEQEWDALLEELAGETGMTAVLTDRDGAMLRSSGARTPLCDRIRSGKESLAAICSRTSSAMLEIVRRTHAPLVDLCEAGMVRIAIPVERDGELVCQVTACGCIPAAAEVETFLVSRMLGMEEQDVALLARSSPSLAEERAGRVADRFHSLLSSP